MTELTGRICSCMDAANLHEFLGNVVANKEASTLAQAEQILLSLKHLCNRFIHLNVLVGQGHINALWHEFDIADQSLPPLLHLFVQYRRLLVAEPDCNNSHG